MVEDRRTVRVEVGVFNPDDLPETVNEFIAQLRALRDSAPEEHRSSVRLEFYEPWDGPGWINVFYDFPEPD